MGAALYGPGASFNTVNCALRHTPTRSVFDQASVKSATDCGPCTADTADSVEIVDKEVSLAPR